MKLIQPQTQPLTVAALVTLVAVAVGCSEAPATGNKKSLKVASTVAPITSIVAAVGGDRINVTGVIPEGTNSHTYEPKPSIAETLAGADVLYVNGLGLEEPTVAIARQVMPSGSGIVALGNRVLPRANWIYDASFPRSNGKPNPHLWTNPPMAVAYARVVRDDLSERDPRGKAVYRANYERFAAAAGRLDGAMKESFATVPRSKRKLLTYHDGYAYFAREYGWQVVGAIQSSDFEDPTPREVADLVDQIRAEKVPAIFGSEVFPSPVLAQISRETGVRYVDQLRDDDLPGAPGEPQHSWIGLMRFNYQVMTETLGGDGEALSDLQLPATPSDTADYPQ
jgi:ABC-type Zn uptake system ZnuABC Zn-binding protein ZnuA